MTVDEVAYWSKPEGFTFPADYEFAVGGIVGVADIVDCVRRHPSRWKARGQWGWVIANARPLPFRECKGAVGFFRLKL